MRARLFNRRCASCGQSCTVALGTHGCGRPREDSNAAGRCYPCLRRHMAARPAWPQILAYYRDLWVSAAPGQPFPPGLE